VGEIGFSLADSVSDALEGANARCGASPSRSTSCVRSPRVYPQTTSRSSPLADARREDARRPQGQAHLGRRARAREREINARAILKAAGPSPTRTSPRSNTCPFGESVELMKNRQIDVTLQSAGLGVAALRDLSAAVKVKLRAGAGRGGGQGGATPAYRAAAVPRPTPTRGPGPPRVPTVAINNLLVTNDKGLERGRLPDDQGALFDNLERLGQLALRRPPDQAREGGRRACRSPLHPGAEKFYREKGPDPVSPSRPAARGAHRRAWAGRAPASLSGTAMSSSVDSPVAVAGKGMLRVVFYSAILFSVFQLVTSAFSPLSSTVVRALHVGFPAAAADLPAPSCAGAGQGRTQPWRPRSSASARCCCRAITGSTRADLVQRAGELTQGRHGGGRRHAGAGVRGCAPASWGLALPLICLGFLAYAPVRASTSRASSPHRGYGLDPGGGPARLRHRGGSTARRPTCPSSLHLPVHPVRAPSLEQAGMIGPVHQTSPSAP
jgi:hypothetical protein